MRSRVDLKQAERANRVLWCLFSVMLILTLSALSFFYLFLVRQVTFVGADRFPEDELIRASGIAYEESIFLVNRKTVKTNLESNPYICVESVKRKLPFTLEITLRERVGCVLTAWEGATLLLDREGVVLHTDAVRLAGEMCTVTGWSVVHAQPGQVLETEEALALSAYTAVAGELEKKEITDSVSSIDVSNPLAMTLITRDGMLVKLGDASNMDTKILWLKQMLTQLPAEGYHGGTLDLTDGKTAGYRPEQTEASAGEEIPSEEPVQSEDPVTEEAPVQSEEPALQEDPVSGAESGETLQN